ncbi:MAG: hypothetical protein ACOCV2_07505 [Persicimonas sp.]
MFLTVWLGACAWAAADDSVAILFHGGVDEAPTYALSDDKPPRAERGEALELLDESVGLSLVRDLKVLPDSGHLLSDVSGRGVVRTDADGASKFVLDEGADYGRVDSSSVLAYAAPGIPARILVGATGPAEATVVDTSRDESVWNERYTYEGTPPAFLRVIALPPDRAAIAATWPDFQLAAIDVYEVEAGYPQEKLRRLANLDHDADEAGADIVEIEALDELRDIKGLTGGNLLVTTRTSLFELEPDGEVVWRVDIGDSDDVEGEFATALTLSSGDVAVATFEPGVWTNQHRHHRVHWLSMEALEEERLEVIASTPALEAAPAGLDRATGHGGSGSADFEPGLSSDGGDPDQLSLDEAISLNTGEVERRDDLWSKATIAYDGDDPLWLRRVAIEARPGSCADGAGDEDDEEVVTLAEEFALSLQTGQTYEVIGERTVDADFSLGAWCASVRASLDGDDSFTIGEGLDFEVVAPADGGSADRHDLDYRQPGDGADGDGTNWSDRSDDSGCATSGARAPGGLGTFLLLVAAWACLRRQLSARF